MSEGSDAMASTNSSPAAGPDAIPIFPTTNMGTPAILYCFIFLYFVFAGAGVWSMDAMIARNKKGPAGVM